MNFIHIIKGWFRSQFYASDRLKKLSSDRLEVCRTCPYAVEKSFLKFRDDQAIQEKTKACQFCGCPVIEKTLVEEEKCHLNLWKK